MKVLSTEKARHVLFRADAGEALPDSLARELRDQAVTCGWYRASGILEDVELSAYDPALGGKGPARRLAGPLHVISLEGSVGIADGDVSFGMRAVLARETDRGMETLAGEIVSARVLALEVLVSAFDDLAVPRMLDPKARIFVLGEPSGSASDQRPSASAQKPPPPAPKSAPGWSDAVNASEAATRSPAAKPTATGLGAAIPSRIARPGQGFDDNSIFPEAGDMVEHFAFGRCEVVKSDGDRLHLRVGKDTRIREIALEMLKVTPLESEGSPRIFRLARRL